MATTLKCDASLMLRFAYQNQLDIARALDRTEVTWTKSIADGAGANQAQRYIALKLTVPAEGTLDVNLQTFGGAEDSLGQTLSLSEIKIFCLKNVGASPITMEPATADGWTGLTDTGALNIGAGGLLFSGDVTASGMPVTASDKVITLANAAVTAVDVHLIVVGN